MGKFQKDLTEGSVALHLLQFSLPFFASNLLQALYNIVDMLIVGHYCSVVGASAVGTGGQVTILVINMISGLAVGGTVMIAQFIGAQRQEEMKRTVGTMFSLYAIAAVVVTVGMLFANRYILIAMDTPSESFNDALAYLNVCTGGTIFIFGYNAVSAVLRGMGDSRHPLLFVAIAVAVNIVLGIVFVGPLGLGPAGSAWATVLAQAVSFILSIIFLRRNDFIFDFHPRSFRIDGKLAGQLIKIGLPASLQGTLVSFSFMWLMGLANRIAGIVGSTALSIAGKVNSVAILPAFAMQASVSSMAGQNLGAGKPERAKKTMLVGMGIAFVFSAAVFAGVNLFPQQIVSLFLGSGGDTGLPAEIVRQCIVDGGLYLRYISLDYLVACLLFCINGLAMGAGQTMFSLVNGIISSLLLRIPAAWILSLGLHWGLSGVGLAAPIASVGALIIGLIYLATGVWKKTKIVKQAAATPI